MNFKLYQDELYIIADQYPSLKDEEKLAIYGLGLTEEAGEVSGIIKRHYRGDYSLTDPANTDLRHKLALELGDTLAYITLICRVFNIDLSVIADFNLQKLSQRIENQTQLGRGSSR